MNRRTFFVFVGAASQSRQHLVRLWVDGVHASGVNLGTGVQCWTRYLSIKISTNRYMVLSLYYKDCLPQRATHYDISGLKKQVVSSIMCSGHIMKNTNTNCEKLAIRKEWWGKTGDLHEEGGYPSNLTSVHDIIIPKFNIVRRVERTTKSNAVRWNLL